ncbi:mitochondrial glutamate carrier 1-like [Brachionus plicatilis]|uniref:Mitochondrial glutamate carrier 2 n=1 Tax=Brachionus plicatilis TaxID=10195 RepID=A0A3M7R4D5_BRAPC|nr:mitochondrial glutamate carrier 1-like [Brachionus plicatilis]
MSFSGFNLDSSNLESSPEAKNSPELSQDQKDRIETNRKRALEIREQKERTAKLAKTVMDTQSKKLVDSGAGFFLDEEELIEEKKKEEIIVEEPSVPTQDQHLKCKKCNKKFPDSFLSKNFDLNVCDTCRNENSEDYDLITKTEAKEQYLLKDCDFDFREPVLKFITKKNPHKNRFGEMKLYLKCQIVERAIVVHESLENLDEKKEQKVANLHKTRQRNYEKKLQNLRKEARQGARKLADFHKHEYVERLILQSDWDEILSEQTTESVWVQYKFSPVEPALNARLYFNRQSQVSPAIQDANDNFFRIEKISNDNKSLNIKFKNEKVEIRRKFVAPVQKFQIHFGDKTKKPLPVLSLDVSSGGLGVSSSQDGQLFLWQTDNGQIRRILFGHVGEVNVCKFFPSGLVILSGADDLRLKIWSCEDASCPVTLTGHVRGVSDFEIIDKGRNIVSVSRDGSCKLFDIGQSKCLATVGQFNCIINCISLSELSDSSLKELQVPERFEALNEREIGTENKIVACGSEDGYLRILSLRARQVLFEFKCESPVNCCCFISETKVVCGTQEGILHVIDIVEKTTDTWKEMRSSILSVHKIGKRHGFIASTADGSCFTWHFDEEMPSNDNFGLVPRIINASIAGIVGVTCVFPLDLAKTRWQNTASANKLYKSYFDCFIKTFKTEGIRGMYKGSGVNLFLITPEKAIKLVANDGFRYMLKSKDGSLPMYKQILAGASAGMCQIVVTTPMELLKIALQDSGRVVAMTQNSSSAAPQSATRIAVDLLKKKGISGLYQGGTATLVRDVSFSAMYFPLFAYINSKGAIDAESKKPPFYHTFGSGILAGSIASYIATPLDVIKTRIQTTTKAPGDLQYNGVVDSFFKILKHESPSAFFKGAVARVCVVAPLFGIAQMFYFLGVAEAIMGLKSIQPT